MVFGNPQEVMNLITGADEIVESGCRALQTESAEQMGLRGGTQGLRSWG